MSSQAIELKPSDKREVTLFARDTLGCRCEDEVFRSITLELETLPDGAMPYVRVVIGRRLLIYLAKAAFDAPLQRLMPELASLGRQERDSRRYNRFRLVLACTDGLFLTDVHTWFKLVVGQDDKAHLHVVADVALPASVKQVLAASRT